MALVATEVASRFQREGVQHDAMAWMLSPRALFDGAAAIDACTDRDACLRGTLLHGLSLGLDAEPGEIDALVDDDDDDDDDGDADGEAIDPRCDGGDLDTHRLVAEGHRTGGGPRHDNVLPLRPKAEPAPRLFTATVVADDGFETVHAFHASFAMDEAEIAGRLYMRMGAAAADAAIVRGFDHTSPIVEALVSQAICAHNVKFDRRHVERRLPDAAGLAWACSCSDIDWRAGGLDGRSLGWLLAQVGFFHGAHRAGDDVDAVIALLRHRFPNGRTALAEMLATARAPSWRFSAVGAAFELKDQLRLRGYRWDSEGDPKCWWREVPDTRRTEEEWWLAGHVYSAEARPKSLGPVVERVTWHERYAPTTRSGDRF